VKKNPIVLTTAQRQELGQFSKAGVHSARLITRAKIIMALDTARGRKVARQAEIAHRFDISRQTVNNTRRDFQVAESVSVFLQRKKRKTPPVEPKGPVE